MRVYTAAVGISFKEVFLLFFRMANIFCMHLMMAYFTR